MSFFDWWTASIPSPEHPTGGYQGWRPCIEWCEEYFGNNAMDGWLYIGEGVFKFREEQNYALFLLRWS